MTDMLVVTDHEEVDKDDFYLSSAWTENVGKDVMREARKLQREGRLFVAYEVPAVSYALYSQMDARKVFINDSDDIVMQCEGEVIGNKFQEAWEGESY